jgi:integrase
MSVKVRQYRRGGFEVDIRFEWADGTPFRERRRAPVESRSAAKRWGEARERELIRRGRAVPPPEKKEVPTLSDFQKRFLDGYARANRQKASGIDSKESHLRIHLVPMLGKLALDQITDERVAELKGAKTHLSPKTVNNCLSVLNKLLDVAVEWKVIDKKPCRIRLLKVPESAFVFYDFAEYDRLVRAAEKCDRTVLATALLGGDAGLRRGEIIGLEQSDLDFDRGSIHVQRSVWKGIVDVPKGGRSRRIPMTRALRKVLREHRHLRGPRVLYREDGEVVTEKILRRWFSRAQRLAGLRANGGLHILRHTFCSHLAMRGAPVKAIQELAGHKDLTTTMRYMHLSPETRDAAIRLLDERPETTAAEQIFGDTVETAGPRQRN